ncbi:hypothetical protein O1Q96_03220 [Streptomyces sp. Qhu-G9]|uniref:hypothetical protein n=1 Tax=Streptomyces sp. Qhu-G9 TaxID=3452799 RepID=UPI0022AC5524|nr:hypothetical protein [Streptomyces aurantiacus]WAU78856.1 hypothetical protein O1Q96_03220 [Streptomyces aurantiacus]
MSGHDDRARHDEHGRHGDDDEHEQHAGNGTVNHGASENSGPEGSGYSDTEALPSDPSPDPASDGTSDNAPDDASEHGSDSASGNSADLSPDDSRPDDASGNTAGDATRDVPDAPADVTGASDAESADPRSRDSGGSGAEAVGIFGLSAVGSGPDGFGSDELALRRLLHQAVEEIEPTDGTLDHLRRAVPARRARKRQAIVGMAAAALFIGTAVPALVHVSNASGSGDDQSIAANASATQGGANEGKEASAGSGSGDSSPSKGSGKGDKKDKPGKGKGSGSGTTGAQPSASMVGAPTCTPAQLTAVDGGAAAPDAGGAVYGTFTVTNVSTASCTAVGDGSVSSSAAGAADQSKVTTTLHQAGDPATSLPDPAGYATNVVLQPGGSYSVKFAWVPSSTCPTTGGTGGTGGGEPTPDPSPSENTAGDSGGTSSEGTSGVGTQLVQEDGTVDGSVTVSYAAEGGAPTAATTVSNACAGTVYRTGMLSGA